MKISNSDIPYLVSLVEKSDQLFDQCFATNNTRFIREPAGKNNSKKLNQSKISKCQNKDETSREIPLVEIRIK